MIFFKAESKPVRNVQNTTHKIIAHLSLLITKDQHLEKLLITVLSNETKQAPIFLIRIHDNIIFQH